VYDESDTATVTFEYSNIVGDDTVSIAETGYTATFADASVGTNKLVTIADATLTGDDAEFYSLPASIEATANIIQQQESQPTFTINYETEVLNTDADSAKYTVCYTATGSAEPTCTTYGAETAVTSITIDPEYLGKAITITKIARNDNYSNSTSQSITLPARPSAPTSTADTFQVTGEHVYTDEYETLTIQPGYEYYKLSSTAEAETECSNTTTGYTEVSEEAVALTGADNIGTYCIRKSAVATASSEAFHSSAAKASVESGVQPITTPIEVSINKSEIIGAWVDANGIVHANQNGTITVLLHEKLHDGTQKLAEPEDYEFTSSVDTDIIKDNTVTFPHASPHIITASLLSNPSITTQVLVEVEPASASNSTSGILSTAITGVPANLLGLVMLMMLVAGFVRARKRTV
jgi:hypothetical protein